MKRNFFLLSCLANRSLTGHGTSQRVLAMRAHWTKTAVYRPTAILTFNYSYRLYTSEPRWRVEKLFIPFTLSSEAYPRGVYRGIYTPKLPKFDLTTAAEYVANLVNVNTRVVNVQQWIYSIGLHA